MQKKLNAPLGSKYVDNELAVKKVWLKKMKWRLTFSRSMLDYLKKLDVILYKAVST